MITTYNLKWDILGTGCSDQKRFVTEVQLNEINTVEPLYSLHRGTMQKRHPDYYKVSLFHGLKMYYNEECTQNHLLPVMCVHMHKRGACNSLS